MSRHRFRILGVDLSLTGPEALVRPFADAYARFTVEADGGESALRVELSPDGELTVGRRSTRLVPGIDPAAQLSHKLQSALMDAIGDRALLHGAALVGGDGCATVLSAPSGHGKSSLAMELVARGFGLLSDDVAALDLRRSSIAPFPRLLSVIPGGKASLPRSFAAAVADDATPTMFGKKLIDIAQLRGVGRWVERELPLGQVILLGRDAEPEQPTVVDLACREADGDEFLARFESTAGVRVVGVSRRDGSRAFRLELEPGGGGSIALAELFDGDRVLLLESHRRTMQADFEGQPELHPVPARRAAERLSRELLNRRRNGRLLANWGGSAAEVFVELAVTLSGVQCWTLCGGSTKQRADRIEALVTPPAGVPH